MVPRSFTEFGHLRVPFVTTVLLLLFSGLFCSVAGLASGWLELELLFLARTGQRGERPCRQPQVVVRWSALAAAPPAWATARGGLAESSVQIHPGNHSWKT